MIRTAPDIHYLFNFKSADDYRMRGYQVQKDVPLDFFPDCQADLLATKNGEKRVVLVRTRTTLAADPKITQLARIIDEKPGWSFDLILVAEPEKLSSPEGARIFERENIDNRLDEVQTALDAGLPEAAFLLAWSTAEAVLRDILAADGIPTNSVTATAFVLSQAAHEGIISPEEQADLRRLRKYRNAIVHGFTMNDFSEDLVTELIETIRRIEREAALDDRSNGQAYSTN